MKGCTSIAIDVFQMRSMYILVRLIALAVSNALDIEHLFVQF